MPILSMASSVLSNTLEMTTSAVPSISTAIDEVWQNDVLWMLIVGFVIAFVLAFAVGANDVANSFGTTVGAGTLTLKQACFLASLFETLGAILLGAKVGATIRKGIIDVEIYTGGESLLMAGEISAMLASGLWQLIATFFKLPVSGTHSIVGATVGFSLVARGAHGVRWGKIGLIVGSWFLSPVLAGLMAAGFYFLLRRLIFQKDEPVRPGLISLPIMYGFTIAINCFSVFFSGAPLLGFDKLSPSVDIVISASIGLIVALLVQFVVVKKLKETFKFNKEHGLCGDHTTQPSVISSNFESKKVTKLPTVMESIAEKESEGSVTNFVPTDPESVTCQKNNDVFCRGDGSCHSCSDIKSTQHAAHTEGYLQSNGLSSVPVEVKRVRMQSVQSKHSSPKSVEDAKDLRRQRAGKRSKSAGQNWHGTSVRLPPLLQLEKKVLKASVPPPSVRDIKEEIRRNFSEPSMLSLTQNSDADVYEVFINRHRKLVTIQRKPSSSSETAHRAQGDHRNGSSNELEKILSNIPPDMKLEDPFDESDDDEGLAMAPPTANDPLMPTAYSGAIEEGFRMLSTSQQNIIAIKIGDEEPDEEAIKKRSKDDVMEAKEGRMEVRKMFSFLQILTACFGAFAHGGNDVSNAIGPLIAIWIIYNEGSVQQKSSTPLWILLYGGVGICFGLWIWGRRVIRTMGKDLTNLTPSRGFAIELMSAITVLAASNVGLPVSTTHCKVGAVVAVGWVRSREAVDWKIFRNIVLAWFVTVPVSGTLSAIIFALLREATSLN